MSKAGRATKTRRAQALPKPPVIQLCVGRRHQRVEANRVQQLEPEFMGYDTSEEEVITSFIPVATEGAVVSFLEVMSLAAFHGPEPPMERKPEKELDSRWRLHLPELLGARQ